MKKGTYNLQIPEPCHESWHAMVPNGKGRYCMHCTKTVVDFTQLTDEQIIAHIQQQNGKLCGRFNQTQLNRTLQIENGRKLKQNKLQGFIAGLLLLLTAGNVNASGVVTAKTEIVQPNDILPDSSNQIKNTETPKAVLTGKVLDSLTKEPLPLATIRNKNTGIGATTDMDGLFEIPASVGDTIEVLYIGYIKKIIVLKSIADPLMVSLYQDTQNMYMVGMIGPPEKHRLAHKIRRFFRMKPKPVNEQPCFLII